MTLGTLHIIHPSKQFDLLAHSVQNVLSNLPEDGSVGVAEIDPQLSDTKSFCEYYGVGLNQSANCVILEAKRGETSFLVACVVLGNTRADINGLVRRTLDVRKVSFAPMEKAVEESGMEYGAITPVGLPSSWPVLIDKAVIDSELVVIGSGLRKSKLIVSGKFLATLPNVQILEGLGNAV